MRNLRVSINADTEIFEKMYRYIKEYYLRDYMTEQTPEEIVTDVIKFTDPEDEYHWI